MFGNSTNTRVDMQKIEVDLIKSLSTALPDLRGKMKKCNIETLGFYFPPEGVALTQKFQDFIILFFPINSAMIGQGALNQDFQGYLQTLLKDFHCWIGSHSAFAAVSSELGKNHELIFNTVIKEMKDLTELTVLENKNINP